mgnify:CR=1 FL=1
MQRKVAKSFKALPLGEIEKLLEDPIHELRLTALLILVLQYAKADAAAKKQIVDFYIDHLQFVNNWDLVDSSAPYILGDWLLQKDSKILDRFAKSTHFWTQRVAIVSTYAFIKAGKFDETMRISELLLHHEHDLIHKAVGWMLREMGKKNAKLLRTFLDKYAHHMPRTMLRYAIEKFSDVERRRYMVKRYILTTKH